MCIRDRYNTITFTTAKVRLKKCALFVAVVIQQSINFIVFALSWEEYKRPLHSAAMLNSGMSHNEPKYILK